MLQLDLLPKEKTPVVTEEKPDPASEKAPGAFKTISEVAESLDVPQHVLRFWESRFSQIKPLKMRGGRRYYRPEDVTILTTVKNLLYKQGYTIKGAKKAFSQRKQPQFTAAPAPVKAKAQPTISPPTDRKLSQLTVIRHELMGMRDVLKPLI